MSLILCFCVICILCMAIPGETATPAWVDSYECSLPLVIEHPALTGDAVLRTLEGGKLVWHLPEDDEWSSITFDLAALKIDPAKYDEIHIRFKPTGGLIQIQPELTAYPVKGLRRHWYSKMGMQFDAWNTARFDLDLDDDGWSVPPKDEYEKRTLKIMLGKLPMGTPEEKPWRDVEIESISFVKRAVSVSFDETAAVFKRTKTRLGWTYDLHVKNESAVTREAKIWVDAGRLKEFKADWTSKTISLKPREARVIPLTLSVSPARAAKLPQLLSERVQVFAQPADGSAPAITPIIGYRPRFMWATIPPDHPTAKPAVLEKRNDPALIARANAALDAEWGVPMHGPPIHGQNYYNSATSTRPTAITWFKHQDQITREILSDEKYTRAYIESIHHGNFNRASVLGDAFLASGDIRYAEAARDVFLEYVKWYPHMRSSGVTGTTGQTRLGLNTLMTSFYFISVMDAYRKIRFSPALNDDDRENIEMQFLLPEIKGLYTHNGEYTNMQVHHYQSYTYAALTLEKYWPLISEAIYGDHGFYSTVDHSYTEDGMSHEGAIYHWYGLLPLVEYAEMMHKQGVNVMNARFKRIFDGTVMNSPQGIVTEPNLIRLYPFAYQVYRDPKYIPTLKAAGLWPPSYLSAEEARKAEANAPGLLTTSSVLPNNGYLWLREQSARGFRAVSLSYIMQIDRLEMDRLHFSIFDPERASGEMGRITYGANEGRLMYSSLGHNTVIVDGKNHLALPSALAAFLDRPALPAALVTDAEHTSIYPGVSYSRAVAILDGIVFVGDLYHAEGKHCFDWPFYAPWEPGSHPEAGMLTTPLKLEKIDAPLSKEEEYGFIKSARGAKSDAMLTASMPVSANPKSAAKPNRELHLTIAPAPDTQLIDARIPRGYYPKPGPLLILRQDDRSTGRFGVAFDITGRGAKGSVTAVNNLLVTDANGAVAENMAAAWEISAESGRYLVLINRTGHEVTAGGITAKDALTVQKLP